MKDSKSSDGSFRKIKLIISWDIIRNPIPVHGIQNEKFLHLLPFHDCSLSGYGFFYILTIFYLYSSIFNLTENVRVNGCDAF